MVKPSFNAGALEIANFSRFPVVDVQEEEERDTDLEEPGGVAPSFPLPVPPQNSLKSQPRRAHSLLRSSSSCVLLM